MANTLGLRDDSHFFSVDQFVPVGLKKSKRVVDILIASSAIVLLSPLLLITLLLVVVSSRGHPIFLHRRVGLNGKQFSCLKFRTMVVNAPERLSHLLCNDPQASKEWAANRKLRRDPRVTYIGGVLRKSSLDELPQLFNVLKGDMSIVGPRPVTEEELISFGGAIQSYQACRPGITGLWQVSGRSTTTYSKRIACDAFYARNWSMTLDMRILIVTLPALITSKGAF